MRWLGGEGGGRKAVNACAGAKKIKGVQLLLCIVNAGEALLYDFEYDLDSTRGRKRILNTVTIYRSKLYILNAQYKCEKV